MADKKVYGMYENKCKVEVIPREDIKKMMIDISVTPNDGIKTKQRHAQMDAMNLIQ